MEKAEDIDEMSQIHIKYVAQLQERSLLSKPLKPIQKAIIEILDLGVLFAESLAKRSEGGKAISEPLKKPRSKLAKRKSILSIQLIGESSDSDDGVGDNRPDTPKASVPSTLRSPAETLKTIDAELARLLPFITAGLRSVGRVGAEPMWEQLAERLEWEGKKDRV